MIPILYEIDETAFSSNGLGRLRDCISCKVTEGRNDVFEVDFDYPVNGEMFDEIRLGRIIGVTHDDTGDVQPFDIVSNSRPLDGIVTFHAVHISYRLSYMVSTGKNINGITAAFNLLESAQPSNPFTFDTDIVSNAYLGAADGTPRTVRELMGGIEGSLLDTYHGEYLFNKFNVSLLSQRGEDRDFTIRYGVNMLDYQDENDSSGTYSGVIPYWTDNTKFVVGDLVSSGNSTITGRGECVPLDVSDKFEKKPTKAQVEAEAANILSSQNTTVPAQSITVSFVRLQDMSEYEEFATLLNCQLCDTIRVEFPKYGTSGRFKIVKVIWDALNNRYDEMELGQLSTSLSEALGITNGLSGGGYGGVSDMFAVTTEEFSYPAISSGQGSGTRTQNFTNSGYYPLGVVGFRTGASAAVPIRFNLSARSSGSCTLSYVLRAVAAVSAGSGDVDILWIKEEA